MVIYKITNTVNNKVYVGQTMKTFKRRMGQHISGLRNMKHKNQHLQSSWNKYGESSFVFEVLEQFDSEMNFDLDNLERYWIKFYDSMNPEKGYNKDTGGNTNKNCVAWNKGKKLTEEHKSKLVEAKRGKNYSEISYKNSPKVPVTLTNIFNGASFTFETMRECANYIGVPFSTVRCHIIRKTKLIKNQWVVRPLT